MPGINSRIIVGVSGSPGSLHALRHAVDLAREHYASLVPVLAWIPPGGEQQARYSPVPELEVDWRKDARTRLTTAFEEGLGVLPADIACEPLVVRGPPGIVLISIADQADDVLVVGAGRRGRIGRLLHAHIATFCIAHAGCCVVAVPPPPLAGTPPRLTHLIN